jgi:hypothetical protein
MLHRTNIIISVCSFWRLYYKSVLDVMWTLTLRVMGVCDIDRNVQGMYVNESLICYFSNVEHEIGVWGRGCCFDDCVCKLVHACVHLTCESKRSEGTSYHRISYLIRRLVSTHSDPSTQSKTAQTKESNNPVFRSQNRNIDIRE